MDFNISAPGRSNLVNILLFANFSVIGAIIGQHKGRHLEIMNSFELVFQIVDDLIVIDRDYYRTKEEQCENSILKNININWLI